MRHDRGVGHARGGRAQGEARRALLAGCTSASRSRFFSSCFSSATETRSALSRIQTRDETSEGEAIIPRGYAPAPVLPRSDCLTLELEAGAKGRFGDFELIRRG